MAKSIRESSHPIVIIGCGPGGKDYVTPLARQIVADSQVLVGADRLFDLFPESTAEHHKVTGNIEEALDRIGSLRKTAQVAVLVTGDPGLMSLAALVIRRFGREHCRVIPGISALQVACARLGLDWQDIRIVDAHGDDPDFELEDLKGTEKIAVFAGRGFSWIIHLAKTLGNKYHIWLCENLTLPGEKVREVDVSGLMHIDVSALSVVMFIKRKCVEETKS